MKRQTVSPCRDSRQYAKTVTLRLRTAQFAGLNLLVFLSISSWSRTTIYDTRSSNDDPPSRRFCGITGNHVVYSYPVTVFSCRCVSSAHPRTHAGATITSEYSLSPTRPLQKQVFLQCTETAKFEKHVVVDDRDQRLSERQPPQVFGNTDAKEVRLFR